MHRIDTATSFQISCSFSKLIRASLRQDISEVALSQWTSCWWATLRATPDWQTSVPRRQPSSDRPIWQFDKNTRTSWMQLYDKSCIWYTQRRCVSYVGSLLSLFVVAAKITFLNFQTSFPQEQCLRRLLVPKSTQPPIMVCKMLVVTSAYISSTLTAQSSLSSTDWMIATLTLSKDSR